MKSTIIALTFFGVLVSAGSFAQFKDIQFHYEIGSYKNGATTVKRDFFKAKIQILQSDSIGITYLNTEIDYNSKTKGMSFGQFTLLKSFKTRFSKFVQPTLGHAAALGRNNYFFAGVVVPLRFGKVTVLPLLLYSYTKDAKHPDARAMVAVSAKLFKKRLQIFGFANAWTYDNNVQGEVKGKKIAWQFTPQIWFHLTPALAIGGKIDYSRNLYSRDHTNDFLPTSGVRWVF
jgi:hypothetical protein